VPGRVGGGGSSSTALPRSDPQPPHTPVMDHAFMR